MRGMLSGLRRRGMNEAERGRLLGVAAEMHRRMEPAEAIRARLAEAGASPDQADAISNQAEERVNREVASAVSLPTSAKGPLNYYFLLGVTPVAGADRIRTAYRQKAKEVHPDRHAQEFTRDQWEDLMTVVADANSVLTDPQKRRAYDVFWKARSKKVTMTYRRQGEKRGDWETRYLWEIAEMAELEEALSTLITELERALSNGPAPVGLVAALDRLLEQYEGAMIEIRTQARTLPDEMAYFAERVRVEMHRKERLVRCLRELLPGAPAAMTAADSHAMAGRIAACLDVLGEIRQAQHLFDLGTSRPFI